MPQLLLKPIHWETLLRTLLTGLSLPLFKEGILMLHKDLLYQIIELVNRKIPNLISVYCGSHMVMYMMRMVTYMIYMMVNVMHKNIRSINNVILMYNVIFSQHRLRFLTRQVIFLLNLSHILIIYTQIFAKFKITNSYVLKIDQKKTNMINVCIKKLIF